MISLSCTKIKVKFADNDYFCNNILYVKNNFTSISAKINT